MIDAISANNTATASQSMKQEIGMNKDDFLKLFITQLKNQDPLSPMDGTQFIAQLAQLTQVEQAYNTNSNLQNILNAMNGSANLSAVSFIGKNVVADGSEVVLADGGSPVIKYRLAGPAASVELNIKDAGGNTVRTMTGGAAAAGDYGVVWDGKDNNGNALPAGTYSCSVSGTDTSGNKTSGTSLVQGTVSGVKLDGATPMLTIDGVDVPLSSVLSVKGVS